MVILNNLSSVSRSFRYVNLIALEKRVKRKSVAIIKIVDEALPQNGC